MEIRINGKAADIVFENEKTIGDALSGLDGWLDSSGYRLSGFAIDGQKADVSLLEEYFSREIETVKVLELFTTSLAELAMESLFNILSDINEYEGVKPEDKKVFLASWKDKAQSLFVLEQMPDLHKILTDLFSGGDMDSKVVYSITEERLREVKNPKAESENLQPLMEEIYTRLIDLPLDLQTGKDARAAQTIQIFSSIGEKLLRIISQLDIQGYLCVKACEETPFIKIVNDFGNLVKDLLDAYERNDTVLVGDLAEYEAVPKLKELYEAIIRNSQETSSVQDTI